MDISPFNHVRSRVWYPLVTGLGLATALLAIGWSGIHRSLWLDEAWVANSVRDPSWARMFWGGEWLQTSPPLFLAVARLAVAAFGLSVETLRTVPLLFAVLAGLAFWGAVRRVSPLLAPVGCVALLFTGTAVEYFTSFKQFGGEAAAVCVVLWATLAYLDDQSRRRFAILFAALVGLAPLAYPLTFVAPGVIFAVYVGSWKRAAILAAGCGVMFAALYAWFIMPNTSPSLWAYWKGANAPVWWLAAVIAGLMWAVWRKNWALVVCAAPCVLLLAAELTGWYPASPRTRLFVRPCAILAAVVVLRGIRVPQWAAAIVALGLAGNAVRSIELKPVEDYTAAVSYLREHAQPEDRIILHADAREGMRLAFTIARWEPKVEYGSTGWPCCLRSSPPRSTEADVRADLARLIPTDYRGRVWIVYGNRTLHWKYLGLDEGFLWRHVPWERGCLPTGYLDFTNVVISPADCK